MLKIDLKQVPPTAEGIAEEKVMLQKRRMKMLYKKWFLFAFGVASIVIGLCLLALGGPSLYIGLFASSLGGGGIGVIAVSALIYDEYDEQIFKTQMATLSYLAEPE